jgi:hypothetical protein
MLTNEQLTQFMCVLYNGLQGMNREQRRLVLKHFKEAKRVLDFNYPEGKPETEGGTDEPVLRPNT